MGVIWSSADRWLGRRPPGPMPQPEDGVRHGFKVSRFPDFWPYWGDGNNPYRALACASLRERGCNLGLFSSVFSPPPLDKKQDSLQGTPVTPLSSNAVGGPMVFLTFKPVSF